MEIFFVQLFCVFLPHFLNIICFCYVHTISVLYYAHLCMKHSLETLIFLMRSLGFPILLLFSISLHWSLRNALLSPLAILWNSVFRWVYFPFLFCLSLLFFFQLFVRTPRTTFLHFFFLGMVLIMPPVQCHKPLIVLQVLYLSDLIPWNYLTLLLYNCKGFDLGHTWIISLFSLLFFNLYLNFAISSWSEPQSAPSLVFAYCISFCRSFSIFSCK